MESDDFKVVKVIYDVIQQDRQTVLGLARRAPTPASMDGNDNTKFFTSLIEGPDPLVVNVGVLRRVELEYLAAPLLGQVIELPEDVFHTSLDEWPHVGLYDESIWVLFRGGQQIAVG